MYDKKKPVLLTRVSTMAVLVVGTIGLGACSSVPDAVNPIEWYHGVEGWFESDKDQQIRNAAKSAEQTVPPVPGIDRAYPNLSTVPERPRGVSSSEDRSRVNKGLAADRDNARYAEPEPERPSGAAMGAPAAARVPVTSEPVEPSRGPSPESLQPLPLDPPPPPAPRSSLDEGGQVADGGQAPAEPAGLQQASFQQTVAQLTAAQPTTAAQPMTIQPTAAEAPLADNGSLVQQTYDAALAQFDRQPRATALEAGAPLSPPGPSGQFSPLVPHSYVVYFGVGSSQLDGPDRAVLRDIARAYKSQGGTVRIVGHASSRTREIDQISHQLVNFRLSSERAEAVASELARRGVPRAAMIVGAVSDSAPVYSEAMPSGEAGNRRVEIFLAP